MAIFIGLPDANPDNIQHIENDGIFSFNDLFYKILTAIIISNYTYVIETKANPIIIENGEFAWKENDESVLREYAIIIHHIIVRNI